MGESCCGWIQLWAGQDSPEEPGKIYSWQHQLGLALQQRSSLATWINSLLTPLAPGNSFQQQPRLDEGKKKPTESPGTKKNHWRREFTLLGWTQNSRSCSSRKLLKNLMNLISSTWINPACLGLLEEPGLNHLLRHLLYLSFPSRSTSEH